MSLAQDLMGRLRGWGTAPCPDATPSPRPSAAPDKPVSPAPTPVPHPPHPEPSTAATGTPPIGHIDIFERVQTDNPPTDRPEPGQPVNWHADEARRLVRLAELTKTHGPLEAARRMNWST